MKQTISSKVLAAAIKMPHEKIIKAYVKTSGRMMKEAMLTIGDIGQIICYAKLDTNQARIAIQMWEAAHGTHESRYALVRQLFGNDEIVRAFSMIGPDSTPPMERFGCRIAYKRSTQHIIIGTGTPYIVELASRAGLSGKATKVLMGVDFAERGTTVRKFQGHPSRVVIIPFEILKSIVIDT